MQTDIDLTKKGEAYAAAALAEADGVFFLTVDGKDRASIATSIEKLINMLDDMEPDPDTEPALGWTSEGQGAADDSDREHDDADLERTLGWELGGGPYNQSNIAMYAMDEVEDENEHGGDINDEPQDGNELEEYLGSSEHCGQGPKIGSCFKNDPKVQCLDDVTDGGDSGGTRFDGDGYVAGVKVLRNLRRKRPDVPQEHVPVACAFGNPNALKVDGLTILGKGAAYVPPPTGDVPVLSAKDFWKLPWA
ncbi:MAG: hypothetical protein JNK47_20295 [Mesorhizobium sp.]|nr:hypothetical protein [Mesorhizobium sp.]MBL8579552.1 hypothetical protein [Mesorhizobium sp.]